MSAPAFGAPLFMSRRAVPLQLVNQTSRTSAASSITISGLPYGAYPTTNRFVCVCLTSQDGGNTSDFIHEAVTWGGLPLNQRAHWTHRRGSNLSSIAVSMWTRFIASGDQGDLFIDYNKSNCDSMGVATFVSTVVGSEVPVGVAAGEKLTGTTSTFNDIATAQNGSVIAVSNIATATLNHISLIGNAGVGAVPMLFDLPIEDDHRMGVFLKTGTPAGSSEDFTLTQDGGTLPRNVWAMASFSGGTA